MSGVPVRPAALLLVPTLLCADEPGAYRFWLARKDRRPWTLALPKGEPAAKALARDAALELLLAERDLEIEEVEGPVASALREARGWGAEPHWLLVSADGRQTREGKGVPTGAALARALEEEGWICTWLKRDAFLREHPDHGEALEARLMASLRMVGTRFRRLAQAGKTEPGRLGGASGRGGRFKGEDREPVADGVWMEAAESLDRLMALPDGWRFRDKPMLWLSLLMRDAAASPRMRASLQRMQTQLLEQWTRQPHGLRDPRPQGDPDPEAFQGVDTLWAQTAILLGNGRLPAWPTLDPVPGLSWPDRRTVTEAWVLLRLPGDHEGILALLGSVPDAPLEAPASREAWLAHTELLTLLRVLRAEALGRLGRWGEAATDLQEARRLAGPRWKELNLPFADPAWKEQPEGLPFPPPPPWVRTLLDRTPEPELPMPAPPPPIRLMHTGAPPAAWEALKGAADLAPWGPAELRWEGAREADLPRLPGGQGFRWAALRGEATTLASGVEVPDRARLALMLSGAGPTRLQRLDAFIRRHPEHLDARRARVALLVPRLPHPVLEARVREDAERDRMPLPFRPGDPAVTDLPAWQVAASRVLPELEAGLRRWPSDDRLWRAWVSWAPFSPRSLSIHAFARSLPAWGPVEDWVAGLPRCVHEAVREDLRRSRRFEAMRAWFREAWEGLTRRSRSTDPADRQAEDLAFDGLSESLRALGLEAERIELERERKGRDGR